MLGRLQRLPPIYTGAIMGLVVGALFCVLHVTNAIRPIEQVAYDARFRLLARPELASPEVVVIGLDNASFEMPEMLESFGRWPWRRKLYAELLWYLRQAPARAIGIDITFAGHDADAESDQLFQEQLAEKKDTVLAFSLNRAGIEWTGAAQSGNDPALKQSAWNVENAGCGPGSEYPGIEAPLPELSAAARALGCIASERDSDGAWRRATLLYRYRGRDYPSLALALAAPFLPGTRPPAWPTAGQAEGPGTLPPGAPAGAANSPSPASIAAARSNSAAGAFRWSPVRPQR